MAVQRGLKIFRPDFINRPALGAGMPAEGHTGQGRLITLKVVVAILTVESNIGSDHHRIQAHDLGGPRSRTPGFAPG
jgi:hypothetical protein